MSNNQARSLASGDFEKLCRKWWSKHMKSEIRYITVKDDGSACFFWSVEGEEGSYHIPLKEITGEEL